MSLALCAAAAERTNLLAATGSDSIRQLEAAVEAAVKRREPASEVSARIALTEAYQATGHVCAATEQGEAAVATASELGDSSLLLRARSALGAVDLAARRLGRAESLLQECLHEAVALGDRGREASLLAGLATLALSKPESTPWRSPVGERGMKFATPRTGLAPATLVKARELFALAEAAALKQGDGVLVGRILVARARAELRHGDLVSARDAATRATETSSALPPGPANRFLQVLCGRILAELAARSSAPARTELLLQAETVCDRVLSQADANDAWAQSYALGCKGAQAQLRGSLDAALTSTLQALEAAQAAGLDEARFEWTWQSARILRAQGDTNRAEAAYRLAVQLLQPLRSDFLSSLMTGTGPGVSADSVTDVYYERADLLLQAARRRESPEAVRELLEDARRTIERLRATDLENYYLDDDCAGLVRANEDSLDAVADRTAVVYTVALPDRTELLVRFASGLRAFVSPVTAPVLRAKAREFRRQLSQPKGDPDRALSRQFWTWLIEPMAAALRENQIQTLVFVPDRELAGIPPAAFLGPDGYLIENQAVAVSPGLSLMRGGALSRARLRPLLCGVSKGSDEFMPLAGVGEELASIRRLTAANEPLLDEAFTTNALARALDRQGNQILHIASHAYFGSDASQTFLLAGRDQRLTMDSLEQLILPHMLSPRPIELLVLSACETAAGDDRAAFGLAGLAVKSGVRTAVASLWPVGDRATRDLMVEFYGQLRDDPAAGRAQALQRAQKRLLRGGGFPDPYHWAAFILVGQWEEPAAPRARR